MRITKLHLAGLVVALAGGAGVKDASANDVTISGATTTPLVTSSPDGISPGDVTVASGGSITVAAGQAAVTINSNNDVTVQSGGQLASSAADNSSGVVVSGTRTGAISNAGAINLTDNYTISDSDNDGNLDGEWATGTNRNGIFLQAGSNLIGNISNTGGINIEGENSAAIRIDGTLTGDLLSTGAIVITGDNSNGVVINGGTTGGVTGDVIIRGAGTVRGENATGVLVNGVIGGDLRINGSWSVSGFHSVVRPANVSAFDPDDTLIGGSAVEVRYSVGGGIVIEGVGVEDDLDDDGDGVLETATNGDPDDDNTAVLTVYGSAPAILIQADPSANLVLGATASGYGFWVRGSVIAAGVYDNIEATGVRIEGDAGGAIVDTAGGVAIDNSVTASANEANAYGLYIGNNTLVPQTLIRGRLVGAAGSETTAYTAYAMFIGAGADVAALNNSGTVSAQYYGETGDAVAIIDQSNTLATITNSGTIQAQVIATDSDPLDNVPPPPITGSAIAIDVSASTIGVTLNQIADTPFTDDDAVDNDSGGRPPVAIEGDILFGSGADTVNLEAGAITGDISFGAGADTFFIDNGATFLGQLSDSDGALTLNIQDGILAVNGGTVNITTATFGANSALGVRLSATPALTTFINASGTVTFAAGAEIVPIVPSGLPASGTFTFLTAAGGLIGAANVIGAVPAGGTPFLYNLSIGLVSGDPNSLEASFIMKTAAQLGLNTNEAIAFSHIIDALRLDADASAAMASLLTADEFNDAYEDLMPNYSGAATELAATAIQQAQGATTNRMAATRLQGLDEVSVWAQEIGYGLDRQPATVNGVEFRGQGFGIAVGIDGPLDNGDLFGLAVSFVASEADEPGRPQGEVSSWFGQANAYYGTAMGPIDLDFVLGAGAGQMRSRRFVEIGSSFSALAEADWWAFEGHGTVRAAVPLAVSDWFVITPQAQLTYVGLSEQAYTEEGGGDAIDYDVDSAFSQRLWADAGIEISARWRLRGGGFVQPRIYAGYRANAIDEESERTVRFVSGGTDFTLTDDGLGDGGPLLGIGLDATNGYSTLSLSYEGEFGDQIERHSINAAVRFRF